MAFATTHPFSGADGQTCSYTTEFISKNAEAAKALGMTEAKYNNHLLQGQWGVYKGKMITEDLPNGTILFKGSTPSGFDATASYGKYGSDDFVKLTLKKNGKEMSGQSISLDKFGDQWLDKDNWNWKIPGAPPPAVSANSKAVGALTDEDAAALFVKVKDDFAKAKGIKVQGANPALDMEVYASIGNQVGYSAKELAAKVEQYKASGHKLSALKKKVLKDESLVAKAWAKKVQALPDPPAIPTVSNVHAPSPTQATKAAEPPKATKKVTTDPPPASTLEATQQAADDALAALKAKDAANAITYTDEQVAKAYIKAKDELASSTENPWTLYTQKNKDFEAAIVNLMEKSYGIDLKFKDIAHQISSYLGDGNKLSVLKKKMAKTGEHMPLAPSLKMGKAEKALQGGPTASAAEAKVQVNTVAGKLTPKGGNTDPLGDKKKFKSLEPNTVGEDHIFYVLKDKIYGSMSDQKVYDTLFDYIEQSYVQANSVKPSVLQLVRAYDRKKAAQLGVENGFFYEKRLANWASTPDGKAYLLKKKTAKEILDARPPLPPSSAAYPTETSVNEARRIQVDMGSWMARAKDGLRHYTGGAYSEMNSYLRGRSTYLSDTNRAAIANAQSGMKATTEKMFVRRGCDFSQFAFKDIDGAIKAIGTKVDDKAFLSTSVGPQAAFGGQLKLEIEVAEGTYGALVKDISKFSHENEFLIAHGTEYQVLSVTPPTYAYGPTTVRLRTVPGSHKRS